jgi:hypothetical protein
MEAVCSSSMLATIYQTTQHHIQKTKVLIFTAIRISNLTNVCDPLCAEPPVTDNREAQYARKTLKKIKTGHVTQIIHIKNVIFFLNTYCIQIT